MGVSEQRQGACMLLEATWLSNIDSFSNQNNPKESCISVDRNPYYTLFQRTMYTWIILLSLWPRDYRQAYTHWATNMLIRHTGAT